MLCAVEYHFVEADRVDEEWAVDALDILNGHTLRMQVQFVDLVAVDWLFVYWFYYDAWNFEMFRIFECVIDPGFDNGWVENRSLALDF